MQGRRTAPSLAFNRREDSPLFAPHPSCRRVPLCPAGVCVLHFSSTKDDVAKNATSKPCPSRWFWTVSPLIYAFCFVQSASAYGENVNRGRGG